MKLCWATVALLCISGDLLSCDQIPVFTVRTEEVRIDVLVTDQGKSVQGLSIADFEVLDNAVPQNVDFAISEQGPVNVTLVLDMSRSVAGDLLAQLKNAGEEILNGLKGDDRAALVLFSNVMSEGAPLTTDLQRVKQALHQAQPAGTSSVIDACHIGMIVAGSNPDRSLMIVFSDGLDTSSWLSSEAVLEVAKRSNTVIYAVSTGNLPKTDFLRDLTQLTGGRLFELLPTRDLGNVFIKILEEFRHRYLLTYSPKEGVKSGWHQIEVRLKHRYAKVMARPGYMRDEIAGEAK